MSYRRSHTDHSFHNDQLGQEVRLIEHEQVELQTRLKSFFLQYVGEPTVAIVAGALAIASLVGFWRGTDEAGMMLVASATTCVASIYAIDVAKNLRERSFRLQQSIEGLIARDEEYKRRWLED